MKARFELTLDGVGCLALVVLVGVIHAFLATRFPERSTALGAVLWIASIAVSAAVVKRASSRDAARRREKPRRDGDDPDAR